MAYSGASGFGRQSDSLSRPSYSTFKESGYLADKSG